MMLTKAQRRVLEFIRDNEPVSRFPIGTASLFMVRRCGEKGWLERCGSESGMIGLTKYRLTDAGRRALEGE